MFEIYSDVHLEGQNAYQGGVRVLQVDVPLDLNGVHSGQFLKSHLHGLVLLLVRILCRSDSWSSAGRHKPGRRKRQQRPQAYGRFSAGPWYEGLSRQTRFSRSSENKQ